MSPQCETEQECIERIEKELEQSLAYYDKVDAQVRKRYFPDPVAWDIIDRMNAEDYSNATIYAAYCLACEIKSEKPLTWKDFFQQDFKQQEEIHEKACETILAAVPAE